MRPPALALAVTLSLGVPGLTIAAPLPTVAPPATADPTAEPFLHLSATSAAAIAAGTLALWGASALEQDADEVRGCRWCEPGRFDLWARERLRWGDPGAAGRASDVLLLAVPLGSAAAVAGLAAFDAGWVEALEDLSLFAAALAVNDPLTTGVKHATARLRPGPWAAGGPRVEGDLHSFPSGHTSRVFAAAAAATRIARLRGRPRWKLLAVVAFGGALATGWLRVGADQHWATDVAAAAVVGTTVGWAVPALAFHAPRGGSQGPAVVPAPGGLAIVF